MKHGNKVMLLEMQEALTQKDAPCLNAQRC